MAKTSAPGTTHDLQPRRLIVPGQEERDDYAALNTLAQEVEQRITEAIDWYLRKKRWPSRASRLLRFLAIVLAVLGGLAPLVSGGNDTTSCLLVNADRWGYILIALAGACLLFDRFFGFSASWMRYMTAQMALQRSLEEFQLSWAVWRIDVEENKPTKDQQNAAYALLRSVQHRTADLIDKEFQRWIAQFQEQLTALQAAIDKDHKERRPGNLVVTYRSQTAITGPADILLNGQLVRQTDSGSILLPALSPATYLVQVRANGGALQGSETVSIEPGQTAELNISLQAVGPNTTTP
jgi:hypothetical protein